MEEEKKVSEETKVKMPNPNPYKKDRGQDCLLYTSDAADE